MSITRAQVEQHNKKDDIWVVHENKVYDVTKFLEEHPGGEEVLLEYAGKDITIEFLTTQHSDDAVEMMVDYLVDKELVKEDHKTFTELQNEAPKSAVPAEGGALLPVVVLIFAIIIWYFYA
eukprot:TRINITY_DN17_c0_g1_i1.p1 TRINITY_DN17_c0_g1~~TRINITY_DN17_c0_g1_i1.p1  ORF type:complete len:121 (+),score=38.46 TRINITY_DN17_c0_g1_i1:79-441(+)